MKSHCLVAPGDFAPLEESTAPSTSRPVYRTVRGRGYRAVQFTSVLRASGSQLQVWPTRPPKVATKVHSTCIGVITGISKHGVTVDVGLQRRVVIPSAHCQHQGCELHVGYAIFAFTSQTERSLALDCRPTHIRAFFGILRGGVVLKRPLTEQQLAQSSRLASAQNVCAFDVAFGTNELVWLRVVQPRKTQNFHKLLTAS